MSCFVLQVFAVICIILVECLNVFLQTYILRYICICVVVVCEISYVYIKYTSDHFRNWVHTSRCVHRAKYKLPYRSCNNRKCTNKLYAKTVRAHVKKPCDNTRYLTRLCHRCNGTPKLVMCALRVDDFVPMKECACGTVSWDIGTCCLFM